MTGLDDVVELDRLDSEHVLETAERFGRQCREAWETAARVTGLPRAEGIESIVVLGMGGSGMAGDVVQAVVEPRLPFFFRVFKGYPPLPEWVGRKSLVFAISYSGKTEETLACVEEAAARGARLASVSSGGELKSIADEYGGTHIAVPAGLQPRAALGYLALPPLGVLVAMGFAPSLEEDVAEAISVVEELARSCHRKVPQESNPAKQLAARLAGRVALVYGGQGLAAVAAERFKCDLNEYAKVPAFFNEIPELNHNEVEAFAGLRESMGSRAAVVMVRDPHEHARVSDRFQITGALLKERIEDVVEVRARGESPLARILSLFFLADLGAIYCALAAGVDPGPVQVLEKLKKELSRR